MKQYICDRCGVIIPTHSNINHHHVAFYDNDSPFADIQYQSNKYNECDLCDDCLERLHNIIQAFMGNHELVVK